MFFFFLFTGSAPSARRAKGYQFDVRHTESDILTGREKLQILNLAMEFQLQKVPLRTASRSHENFAKF